MPSCLQRSVGGAQIMQPVHSRVAQTQACHCPHYSHENQYNHPTQRPQVLLMGLTPAAPLPARLAGAGPGGQHPLVPQWSPSPPQSGQLHTILTVRHASWRCFWCHGWAGAEGAGIGGHAQRVLNCATRRPVGPSLPVVLSINDIVLSRIRGLLEAAATPG